MKNKILNIITELVDASPKQISDITGLSRQMVHQYLREMVDTNLIIKIGKSPKVFYQINTETEVKTDFDISEHDRQFLSDNFFQIREDGKFQNGIEAFSFWCYQRNLHVEKTIIEFKKTIKKYEQYKNAEGYIEGINKLNATKGFQKIHLKEVYYNDFYAIERFGKTKLGVMLHFAKQSQSKKLCIMLIDEIKSTVYKLIDNISADAVAFIPPTIHRNVQFMRELENRLDINLPKVKLDKVKGEIIIPQKALSKLSDRISNARKSIVTTETKMFKKVLVIDDALGSGATINETAGKLIKRKIATEVYGLAITGSFKGFDIISEA